MTSVQKFIKIAAVCLAIFLCISILGGIIAAVAGLSVLLGGGDPLTGDVKEYNVSQDIHKLEIDIRAGQLRIVSGDHFGVESNHKYLKVSDSQNKLYVRETKQIIHATDYEDVVITLTVPEGHVFQDTKISTGAGLVTIEQLSSDTLQLEFGAGEVMIHHLEASKQTQMECGAGRVTISACKLHDLDLDMGVGKMELSGLLSGKCDIDHGVGEAKFRLMGSLEDYKILVDKGMGDVQIAGGSVSSGTYGSGENAIDIDGGVGAIRIEFDN